ncbi:MAG TPA: M20/M25/M40 family metallo-hydrolase [Terriglobales bacterium]|jgi:Zn-dependent M28 family amino/carboxypeptidase|nr:M20/M25/M40 family metallo-hydrolase [Terriglobales bacterium]
MIPKTLASMALCFVTSAGFCQTPTTTSSVYSRRPTPTSAEDSYSPQLRGELKALRDAALTSDYAWGQVAHITENIGPRPEGSPQAEFAATYVADELRKLGMDVHLEEVKVPKWTRGAETAELVEWPGQTPGTTQKVVLTALSGNAPTSPDGLTAEIVVVRNFDELKALGREKVAGKIVLFNEIYDQKKAAGGKAFEAYGEAVVYRGEGAKKAADLGAVGSLVRSVGDADYRIPHTGGSTPAGIPQGAVASEDAELISHLAAQGKVRIHMVLLSQTGAPVLGHNVIADIKGSEHPEQIVVVSGHLDSWDLARGAIDDAAGVGVAMATAQLIHELHLHPRRTIRVIAWMDEENFGSGQTAYTKAHGGEFANHVGAIESDSGAGHPLGFQAKIVPAAVPFLRPMLDMLSGFGANLLDVVGESPEADIGPMSEAGVPAFGLEQDGRNYFKYHHTPADTLDKINPQELRENAAAMAVLGYTLACLPEPLPR